MTSVLTKRALDMAKDAKRLDRLEAVVGWIEKFVVARSPSTFSDFGRAEVRLEYASKCPGGEDVETALEELIAQRWPDLTSQVLTDARGEAAAIRLKWNVEEEA